MQKGAEWKGHSHMKILRGFYLQSKQVSKPHTNLSSKLVISLKKKFDFEKPSLRCSGPYFSDYERELLDSKVERKKHLGRSRFIFKGEMSKN